MHLSAFRDMTGCLSGNEPVCILESVHQLHVFIQRWKATKIHSVILQLNASPYTLMHHAS